jgi:hypothetical protein
VSTDDEHEPEEAADDTGNRARVLRFARRLLDRKELAEDTKELVSAVLSSSDKAKNEAIRVIAREVRSYLKELKVGEMLSEIVKDHSLEISVRFKPLAKSDAEDPAE